ncbi:DgyrCDS977 [Dimorphilus gyrociliatus]|uniref:DgyrCDS977 n=1 Tax=Dimorphilus gyrociliatus TaxID=2664684 RepID=A0A7I8V7P7_9ANNE|nr:DgyrCDS977 [Dimorphilus gyrociliatus]
MEKTTQITQITQVTQINNYTNNSSPGLREKSLKTWGLVALVLFYALIVVIGIIASCCRRRKVSGTNKEDLMLAGRNIGLLLGTFTMTATWVGGGYINGTAESVYTSGLIWAQAPIGYSISLCLGGLIFAKSMRKAGYVTMLDAFEARFGRIMAALLYIPALMGEIFWSAAILNALGASLSVIIALDHKWSIIISAGVAITYVLFGGLFSVAFTDVIQLFCILIGLWLAIPFALTNSATRSISDTFTTWWDADQLPEKEGWSLWSENALLLIFGGIPWQVYFQRVLSAKNERVAQLLSFFGALGCLIMAIPAILVGAIAKSTKWNETDYKYYGKLKMEMVAGQQQAMPDASSSLILPYVLEYLTPVPVAVIGLGAISAAVMSSADSSILSASSMFAKNIYDPLMSVCFRRNVKDRELIWIVRLAIFFIAAAACALAIQIDSVYTLWYLSSDLCYVIILPQLICAVHVPYTEKWGSIAGFLVGIFFRLSGGDKDLDIPALIEYPYYDAGTQNFPYKTLSMLISLITLLLVSAISYLYKKKSGRRHSFEFVAYGSTVDKVKY